MKLLDNVSIHLEALSLWVQDSPFDKIQDKKMASIGPR